MSATSWSAKARCSRVQGAPRVLDAGVASATAPSKSASGSSSSAVDPRHVQAGHALPPPPAELDVGQVPHQAQQRHRRRRHGAAGELLGVQAGALHLGASGAGRSGSPAAWRARRRATGRPPAGRCQGRGTCRRDALVESRRHAAEIGCSEQVHSGRWAQPIAPDRRSTSANLRPGSTDWMIGCCSCRWKCLVACLFGRRVAAADMPADQAHAQVYPRRALPQAVLATIRASCGAHALRPHCSQVLAAFIRCESTDSTFRQRDMAPPPSIGC